MPVDIAGDDVKREMKISLAIGAGVWALIQAVSFLVFIIHSGVENSDELFVYYASGVLSLLAAAVALLYILVLMFINGWYRAGRK